jgi:enoyl-CoA hydratase/carnithine racemase
VTQVVETGLRIETAGGVRTIVFSRPGHRNAMTTPMFAAYYDALAAAEADPAVRAVVITGDGDWFCTGADTDSLDGVVAATAGGAPPRGPVLGHPVDLPLRMSVPIIAAVNGGVAGLGLVHALFADVRFIAAEAKLSTAFSRLGLIAEYGIAWLLPRLVGPANALDLLLSGRKLDAAEALRMGLVQRVLPRAEVLAAATAYAQDLATNCSPAALAVIRRQVWAGWEQTATEAVEQAVGLMAEAFTRPDLGIALRARVAGQTPEFPPRADPAGGPAVQA